MDKGLRILLVEDSDSDADLITREIAKAGLVAISRIVRTRDEFLEALAQDTPDIILCDYNMPGFGAPEALEIAKKICLTIPFVVVSGTIGEELAVDMLKSGASDYIMKDKIFRLPSVIKRALKEAGDRAERARLEEALWLSEQRMRVLISNLPGFIYRCANDRNWTMKYMSEGCRRITGYAPDDFLNNSKLAFNDIVHPDFRELLWEKWQEQLKRKEPFEHEYPIITASGETRWVWERGRGIFAESGELLALEGFITDITDRKRVS